jgi:hypothetical protein
MHMGLVFCRAEGCLLLIRVQTIEEAGQLEMHLIFSFTCAGELGTDGHIL